MAYTGFCQEAKNLRRIFSSLLKFQAPSPLCLIIKKHDYDYTSHFCNNFIVGVVLVSTNIKSKLTKSFTPNKLKLTMFFITVEVTLYGSFFKLNLLFWSKTNFQNSKLLMNRPVLKSIFGSNAILKYHFLGCLFICSLCFHFKYDLNDSWIISLMDKTWQFRCIGKKTIKMLRRTTTSISCE